MMLLTLGREVAEIDRIRMSNYLVSEKELFSSYGLQDGTKIKVNILDDSHKNTKEDMMRMATGRISICDRKDDEGNNARCTIWFNGYFDWDEKAEYLIMMPFYEVESFEIMED